MNTNADHIPPLICLQYLLTLAPPAPAPETFYGSLWKALKVCQHVLHKWFQRFPEQAELGYALPSDTDAAPLTTEEVEKLGQAIIERKKQINNWFRYQRTKLGQANATANHSQASKLQSLIDALLQDKPKPKKCASQVIEVFRRRNRDLIKARLTDAGYDSLGARDTLDNNNNENEADTDDRTESKSIKSQRMRLRTRVVNALWQEASDALHPLVIPRRLDRGFVQIRL
ncbi:hypothetical protein B0H14DRAFT_3504321 [Mycena olivaceomarginata]|nr:hypothetical protein B0H14DRAFT_3504321 [Mycena olivaceomarginata]